MKVPEVITTARALTSLPSRNFTPVIVGFPLSFFQVR
jgi:hypothetical protein